MQEKEERGSQTRLKEMKCRPMILRELSQLVTCLMYRSVEMGYCRYDTDYYYRSIIKLIDAVIK